MQSRFIKILVHLLGIAVFLSFPFIFSPPDDNLTNEVYRNFIRYILMVGFFYLNFYILIPKLYFSNKYWLFGLTVLAAYIFITLLPEWLIPFHHDFKFGPMPFPNSKMGPPPMEMNPRRFIFFNPLLRPFNHNLFLFFVVFFISMAIRITLKLKNTEKEKLKTELSYLKAQVNPHFLFNTLNSIYSLAIRENADESANAIVTLSDMMRYTIHDTVKDFVPLDKELSYLRDYIYLQKLRWGKDIPINFRIEGIAAGHQIAPVILQPFIENAFKYGINTESKHSYITILINIEEDKIVMEVSNAKVAVQHSLESNSGLGIENTSQRLHMLYPDAHKLRITENEDNFSITLTLLKI
ncbi:histidine kinase [Limibacter armeniacum]|uniref:sensor histidine kinase n=1 Tax=Limibacter armeniacum TaxID=466084 RepID=UPI002FE6555F